MSVLTWKPVEWMSDGKVVEGHLGKVHLFSVLDMNGQGYKWITAPRTILECPPRYRERRYHHYKTKKSAMAACEAMTQAWLGQAGLLEAAKIAGGS